MNRFTAQSDARSRRAATGYSLAELLVAIAILGVGMAMAAQLFPAGLLANQYSGNDLIGTMICQNGIAIAKAMLSHPLKDDGGSDVDDDSLAPCMERIDHPDDDGEDDGNSRYPVDYENDNRGFFVLARRAVSDANVTAGASANDYQLVVISYRKGPGAGDLTLETLTGNCDEDKATVTFGLAERAKVQVGSPVIVATDGTHARILEKTVDASAGSVTVVLDRPLEDGSKELFVLHEENALTSPAMAVMVARTALKQ